jgi:endonuclease/exonuclease/phosphatase (EEP) superfamily protein YafD
MSSSSLTAGEAAPPRLRLWGLAAAAAMVAAAGSLAGWAGSLWWGCDLLSHFRVQYAVIGLVGGLLLWLRGHRVWAAFAGLVALANLAVVAPLDFGPPPRPVARTWRLLQLNVHTGNRTPDRVLDYLRQCDADIVVLEEVNGDWLLRLEPWLAGYPYRIAEPEEDNFGLVVASRLPVLSGGVVWIGEVQVPSVVAELNCGGRPLHLVATHPVPPIGTLYTRLRNEQLERLAERIAELPGPVLLAGDLNATSWSHAFRRFTAHTGLHDSRRGFGVQPTWPSFCPPLQIPIDHVLASPEVVIRDRQLGPSVGSDHLPVLVTFGLAARTE